MMRIITDKELRWRIYLIAVTALGVIGLLAILTIVTLQLRKSIANAATVSALQLQVSQLQAKVKTDHDKDEEFQKQSLQNDATNFQQWEVFKKANQDQTSIAIPSLALTPGPNTEKHTVIVVDRPKPPRPTPTPRVKKEKVFIYKKAPTPKPFFHFP